MPIFLFRLCEIFFDSDWTVSNLLLSVFCSDCDKSFHVDLLMAWDEDIHKLPFVIYFYYLQKILILSCRYYNTRRVEHNKHAEISLFMTIAGIHFFGVSHYRYLVDFKTKARLFAILEELNQLSAWNSRILIGYRRSLHLKHPVTSSVDWLHCFPTIFQTNVRFETRRCGNFIIFQFVVTLPPKTKFAIWLEIYFWLYWLREHWLRLLSFLYSQTEVPDFNFFLRIANGKVNSIISRIVKGKIASGPHFDLFSKIIDSVTL